MSNDGNLSDLIRALEVFTDNWEKEIFTDEELCSVLDALDDVIDGNIDYNQFIKQTGVEELKKFLIM